MTIKPMTKDISGLVESLTFPSKEAEIVEAEYNRASVILEYGSGSSTVYASGLADKTVFSVESDARWAYALGRYLDGSLPLSAPRLHHVDIGPTGAWGRPYSSEKWENFKEYALSVWDRSDFVAPDVVLIDGRFRLACFVTVAFRTRKPIIVLIDDYVDRQAYHVAETLYPAVRIGRMARFEIPPSPENWSHIELAIRAFGSASYAPIPQKRGLGRVVERLIAAASRRPAQ